MLEIAAFGKISVGKSAVLNALFAVDVFTVDVRGGSTIKVHRHEVEFAGQRLAILDTPGIGEVDGHRRADAAYRAAELVDLVLVVFDHDLTEIEYAAVEQLGAAGKPLLVVLNKADALSAKQRVELSEQIGRRLNLIIDASNVVICAADPIRRYVREHAGGRIEEWTAKAPSDVAVLRDRLASILETESPTLQRLDEVRESIGQREKQRGRASRKAEDLIENYALGIGAGIMANPLPLVDVLGGGVALGVLVSQLADCHEVAITQGQAQKLGMRVFAEGWQLLLPALATLGAGALMKFIPFVGWLASAAAQGAAAYYVTFVIGQAVSSCLAAGSWRDADLHNSLRQIIQNTDRESLTRRAAERLKQKLR